MKKQGLIIAGIAVALLLVISNTASAATGTFNLSLLSDQYGSDNVQRLQNLLNVLSQQGLTDLQIQMMLAQALQETGLFTDVANYNAVDTKHNYAGISYNGTIATYSSISDFVSDWLRVLTMGNDPLGAANIEDFNTRLKANGYYTDDATKYGNNLKYYFNLLSGI